MIKLPKQEMDIFARCVRQILQSDSKDMLQVAKKYCQLFSDRLNRKKIDASEANDTFNWIIGSKIKEFKR